MSNPITPPPELVDQWFAKALPHYKNGGAMDYVAQCAAQWGADQELEACCEYVYERFKLTTVACVAQELRTARRPPPPSLKEQALNAINAIDAGTDIPGASDLIRRALEQLDD